MNHRDHRYCQPTKRKWHHPASHSSWGVMRCVLRNGMESNGMGWGRPEWNRKEQDRIEMHYWRYGWYCSKKRVLVIYIYVHWVPCKTNFFLRLVVKKVWKATVLAVSEHLRAAISTGHQKEKQNLDNNPRTQNKKQAQENKSNVEHSDLQTNGACKNPQE